MLVKVVNLAAEIVEKDVAIAIENHKLVMEMNTVLEDYGKIKKFAKLPVGVNAYDLVASYGVRLKIQTRINQTLRRVLFMWV